MERSAKADATTWACIVALVAACSASSGGGANGACNGLGSASVNGTVQGTTFAAHDAISFSPGNIQVADFAGLCAHGLGAPKANATYIDVLFHNGYQLGTTAVGPALDIRASVWDSKCNSVEQTPTSGNVTLTAIEPCSVVGTFDVVLVSAEHLTGSFNAPMCNTPGNGACM
jgi:hypothetical protein